MSGELGFECHLRGLLRRLALAQQRDRLVERDLAHVRQRALLSGLNGSLVVVHHVFGGESALRVLNSMHFQENLVQLTVSNEEPGFLWLGP